MVVRTLAFLVLRLILGVVGAGRTPDANDVEIAGPAAPTRREGCKVSAPQWQR
jgi:hypothetical protein